MPWAVAFNNTAAVIVLARVQLGDATAVVVFLHLDEDRKLHALVNVDPVGLPGTTVAVNHRDVVDITVKDYSKFIADTGVEAMPSETV